MSADSIHARNNLYGFFRQPFLRGNSRVEQMIEGLLNLLLEKFGYKVSRVSGKCANEALYALHEYLDEQGSFDYELYRKTQEDGNKRKIDWVWAKEENISFISSYIQNSRGTPQFGICHGTRCGREQEWFRRFLGCDVIGTEISDTAEQFPNTIQWDFHEVKPEWLGAVDFIYSNSFDHSYDPEKCLNAWMSCLKKNGLCIIEHSSLDGLNCSDELDAFGAEIATMPYLITLWGNGCYGVRQILKAPITTPNLKFLSFIVIQRF